MAKKGKDITILDVTLRDGSYVIDYQYTTDQVRGIAAALDGAGIDCIEISHGCGLGAGKMAGLAAAHTDAEYVGAAREVVKRAMIGVIAGAAPITLPADIDSVIDSIDFIRFAANCDEPQTLEENIKYSLKKRPKLSIFMQLMRSSRRPYETILEAGRMAADMGVQVIYIVDTAGHYLPEEVAELTSRLVEDLPIGVGFHGHNNMGLAIANSLAAARAGAASVDGSLRGMGRAGGNAQLDALVSLLKRIGMARSIDLDRVITAGEEHVAPIMPPARGIDSIDVLTADANIDLYPPELYARIAKEAGVGLLDFVRRLAADPELVEAKYGEIERALKGMGVDAKKVLSALQMKKPS